jgi:hypothetical protein
LVREGAGIVVVTRVLLQGRVETTNSGFAKGSRASISIFASQGSPNAMTYDAEVIFSAQIVVVTSPVGEGECASSLLLLTAIHGTGIGVVADEGCPEAVSVLASFIFSA